MIGLLEVSICLMYFFHRFPQFRFRTSEAVPAARNLGRRALRGRPEHTAGMLGGRSATTWGRSFPQDLHLCGNFFISASCKGISWLSVIDILDILDDVISMV